MRTQAWTRDRDGCVTGIVEVRACDSRDHEPRFATKLCHWPTGPVEYCDDCCAWMLEVARVLGVHVHVEPIAVPVLQEPRRGIELRTERSK